MDLPVVNHKDYFAKIGDDHKFPINKFGDLANYLIDSSDNYWETIEFFEELEYEPIYSLNNIGENE